MTVRAGHGPRFRTNLWGVFQESGGLAGKMVGSSLAIRNNSGLDIHVMVALMVESGGEWW